MFEMRLNFSAAMISGVLLAVTILSMVPHACDRYYSCSVRDYRTRTDGQIKDSGLSEYENNFFVSFHMT